MSNKTKIIIVENDYFKIDSKTGAETGDLIYDKSEKNFYPIYQMGNTNICFDKDFQKNIHKVLASTRGTDKLPFKKTKCNHKFITFGIRDAICEKCGCYDRE
jgi:hypothetical protein